MELFPRRAFAGGGQFVRNVISDGGQQSKDDAETYDSDDDEDQDGLWEWFLTGGIGHGAGWFYAYLSVSFSCGQLTIKGVGMEPGVVPARWRDSDLATA